MNSNSLGIIGGADGPTVVLVSGHPIPWLILSAAALAVIVVVVILLIRHSK